MNIQELFSLKGKTAIITGGGRGLGQQIATAYAEAGANIVVCSRNLDACQQFCDALQEKVSAPLHLNVTFQNWMIFSMLSKKQ